MLNQQHAVHDQLVRCQAGRSAEALARAVADLHITPSVFRGTTSFDDDHWAASYTIIISTIISTILGAVIYSKITNNVAERYLNAASYAADRAVGAAVLKVEESRDLDFALNHKIEGLDSHSGGTTYEEERVSSTTRAAAHIEEGRMVAVGIVQIGE